MNIDNYLGLADDHLRPVNENHQLHCKVVADYERMRKAAKSEGHHLEICSSYRSFERQLSIWQRKWHGELPLYRIDGSRLVAETLNDQDKIHAIMLWSALPGASRHHWGTDFDVYDPQSIAARQHKFELITAEYENDGPCAALNRWISTHAEEFGFYRPYAKYLGGVAEEPWHLSHKVNAQQIEQAFSLDALRELLSAREISGKETILTQLDYLYQRYTLNLGI